MPAFLPTTTGPGLVACSAPKPARSGQLRFDLRSFIRSKESVSFTLALPIVMLLIFASVFSNATVKVPGGTVNESVYYVPAIITFGLIAAGFKTSARSCPCTPLTTPCSRPTTLTRLALG